MTTSGVTIIGLPELKGQLNQLTADMQGPVVEAAVMAGALPIQNRWKELTPFLTGTYRRSIHTEAERDAEGAWAVVGTDITDPPYPVYLEFGTAHMGAQPSMRPAYDEMQGAAVQEVTDVLNELLVRYGGK